MCLTTIAYKPVDGGFTRRTYPMVSQSLESSNVIALVEFRGEVEQWAIEPDDDGDCSWALGFVGQFYCDIYGPDYRRDYRLLGVYRKLNNVL